MGTATQQDQELKDTPEDEVEGRPQHRQQDARDLIMLEPRTPRPTSTAEFPHPTGIRRHEEAQPAQDLAGQRNGPELLELRCEPQSSGVFSIGFTT
ncbi:hypothetical protein GCM10022224_030310 [Nonomuraea antimicrobica]|uniref:Uncharacterized protein n=1 Tax=Nonomuraea antimicrobica TaxID=561173 RepID=A0ABP7BLB6_9ACTN